MPQLKCAGWQATTRQAGMHALKRQENRLQTLLGTTHHGPCSTLDYLYRGTLQRLVVHNPQQLGRLLPLCTSSAHRKNEHELLCCASILQQPQLQNWRPWLGPGRFVTRCLAFTPQWHRPNHRPAASYTDAPEWLPAAGLDWELLLLLTSLSCCDAMGCCGWRTGGFSETWVMLNVTCRMRWRARRAVFMASSSPLCSRPCHFRPAR